MNKTTVGIESVLVCLTEGDDHDIVYSPKINPLLRDSTARSVFNWMVVHRARTSSEWLLSASQLRSMHEEGVNKHSLSSNLANGRSATITAFIQVASELSEAIRTRRNVDSDHLPTNLPEYSDIYSRSTSTHLSTLKSDNGKGAESEGSLKGKCSGRRKGVEHTDVRMARSYKFWVKASFSASDHNSEPSGFDSRCPVILDRVKMVSVRSTSLLCLLYIDTDMYTCSSRSSIVCPMCQRFEGVRVCHILIRKADVM